MEPSGWSEHGQEWSSDTPQHSLGAPTSSVALSNSREDCQGASTAHGHAPPSGGNPVSCRHILHKSRYTEMPAPPDLRCLLTETQAMSACVGTAVSEQIPLGPCRDMYLIPDHDCTESCTWSTTGKNPSSRFPTSLWPIGDSRSQVSQYMALLASNMF